MLVGIIAPDDNLAAIGAGRNRGGCWREARCVDGCRVSAQVALPLELIICCQKPDTCNFVATRSDESILLGEVETPDRRRFMPSDFNDVGVHFGTEGIARVRLSFR